MSIINFQFEISGQVALTPRLCRLTTTDTFDEIIAAGYLDSLIQQGNTVEPTDFFFVNYGTNSLSSDIFTVSFSGGVCTLVPYESDDGVTLPVVDGDFAVFDGTGGVIKDAGYLPSNAAKTVVVMANGATTASHIATYSDTTGTISQNASPAINPASIQAGLTTGTAGTFIACPGTGSKGTFIIEAIANTGNTNVTLTNVAHGQASVYSIPDCANTVGRILNAATATPFTTGHLIASSGTGGLTVDSGVTTASVSGAITQLGQLYQTTVTLTAAEVIAAYATPQVLIAAVASKVAVIITANVYLSSTGQTAFATGDTPIIQYGTTVHGGGTIAVGTGLVTGDITSATSQIRTIGPAASTTYTGITDTAVTFSCGTAYTAGTGSTVTFTLVYQLITATV